LLHERKYKAPITVIIEVLQVGSQVTLEMIYDEVKQVNKRLSLLEDAIEEVIVKGLPKANISKKEKEEIKRSIEEMKKGNCVTLEELKSA
jgi:hypothetical protein